MNNSRYPTQDNGNRSALAQRSRFKDTQQTQTKFPTDRGRAILSPQITQQRRGRQTMMSHMNADLTMRRGSTAIGKNSTDITSPESQKWYNGQSLRGAETQETYHLKTTSNVSNDDSRN